MLMRKGALIGKLATVVALVLFGAFLALSIRSVAGLFSVQSLTIAPAMVAWLLPLAVWSFGLRLVRLHVLLRRVVPGLKILVTLRTQAIGFALAVSPGRLAEFYKLQTVQKATGVSVATSLPAVIAERLTDLSAFGALAIVGGLLSWSGADDTRRAAGWLVLGLGVIAGAFVYQTGWNGGHGWLRIESDSRLSRLGEKVAKRLPLANTLIGLLRQLWAGSTQLASPKVLGAALGAVVVARLADVLVIYLVAQALGYPVSFTTAMLMMGLTGLAGGLSLAPGGMGAAEAALAALAVAQGIPLEAALTIALVTRMLTFWIWVVVGLVVFGTTLVGSFGRTRARPAGPANAEAQD